jgi:low temperature requirement protein LtrA
MTHPVERFRILTRMTARETDEEHRTASPLELLFDLTFVVAVAQIADQLAIGIGRGQGFTDVVPFLMVFFAIWWAWINFTWFASAYDTDDVPYRLMTLVQMGGVLVLAAGVPSAFTAQNFLGITIGYVIMRIGIVGQWVRAASENPDGRATAIRYAVGVALIQLGWIARLWLPLDSKDQWWSVFVSFFVLVALEVVVPLWAQRRGDLAWHPHHIAERYSLFAIILLGETVAALTVGIGLVLQSPHHLASLIIAAVSLLVLIFGLWWVYFMEPAGEGLAARRGLSFYWGYGHYFIFAALGALGAGIEVVIAGVGPHPVVAPLVAAYAVAVPTAIYVAFLWAANAPLVTRVVIRAWIVAPVVALLALAPLVVSAIGLAWDVSVIAGVIVLFVVVSVAVKIRTHQDD